MFSQSTYSVDKDNIPAQLTLVLSAPFPTTFTVEVSNYDEFAIGEYYKISSEINNLRMTCYRRR